MIEPGKSCSFTVHPTKIDDVMCFCGGSEIEPADVVDLGGGDYRISFDGTEITCPGPLQIKEGTTVLHEESVGPCP